MLVSNFVLLVVCAWVDGWMVEVLLYIHRNRRFREGWEPRTATSTFTQLLSSADGWMCVRERTIPSQSTGLKYKDTSTKKLFLIINNQLNGGGL